MYQRYASSPRSIRAYGRPKPLLHTEHSKGFSCISKLVHQRRPRPRMRWNRENAAYENEHDARDGQPENNSARTLRIGRMPGFVETHSGPPTLTTP